MKTKPLYPYQSRVSSFACSKSRVGIFSFFGSGKSYLSLKWLEDLQATGREVFPCLVLAPKSLITQWGEEINKHTDFTYSPVVGTCKKRLEALAQPVRVYIINYDAVRSSPVFGDLIKKPWKSVIVDESTYLKEARTKRFKLLRSFTKDIPYRAILTGKPITEEPENLWSQMLFLDDGESLGRAFWKFRMYYFFPGPPWAPYDWNLKPGAAEAIARACKNCIRVKKEEVLAELPPQIFNKIHFKMPAELREMYKQLKREFQLELPSGAHFETQWAVVKSTKLHQLCQGFMYTPKGSTSDVEELESVKLQWLEENLPILLSNGPVLIWTNFRAVLSRICKLIEEKLLLTYVPFHGGMKSGEQELALKAFQEGQVDILVLTLQAGAHGLNLQRANQAIFFNNDYKADLRENAIDRCHRLGSEIHKNVTYYDLVIKNSIDEVVLKVIKNKLNLAEEIMKHIRGE